MSGSCLLRLPGPNPGAQSPALSRSGRAWLCGAAELVAGVAFLREVLGEAFGGRIIADGDPAERSL